MAVAFPIVRGRKYDWSNIEISLVLPDGKAAQIFIECNAITWDDTIEETLVYGTNAAPVGRTRGVYNPGEGSITMTRQMAAVLVDQLGDGYMEKEIDINCKYSDPQINGGQPITDALERCRITGIAPTYAQGGEALMDEVKFKPMTVLRNGKTPLLEHLR